MIICNSKRFIYIHIPKCGGTTISSMLEANIGPQDISLNLNPHAGWAKFLDVYQQKYGLFKHSTAQEITRAIGADVMAEYEVFTYVRNPFARAYSAYTFTLKSDALYRPESDRYHEIKDMSFEQFLDSQYVRNHEILPTKLQSRWLENCAVPIRPYKLEKVDQSLPWLCKRFFGTENVSVPRKNFSTEKEAWKNISAEAVSMIRDIFARDFAAFSYGEKIDR